MTAIRLILLATRGSLAYVTCNGFAGSDTIVVTNKLTSLPSIADVSNNTSRSNPEAGGSLESLSIIQLEWTTHDTSNSLHVLGNSPVFLREFKHN
jgi:hypothetical protein